LPTLFFTLQVYAYYAVTGVTEPLFNVGDTNTDQSGMFMPADERKTKDE